MKKSRAPVIPRKANHFASNVIAISIAPRWVELILKGHKTVEASAPRTWSGLRGREDADLRYTTLVSACRNLHH